MKLLMISVKIGGSNARVRCGFGAPGALRSEPLAAIDLDLDAG